ncbi:hypothetical protein NDA01_31420 [Trichocoleus desertorum AS-A10]
MQFGTLFITTMHPYLFRTTKHWWHLPFKGAALNRTGADGTRTPVVPSPFDSLDPKVNPQ